MTNAAEDQWPRRAAILGVGLLGGSVALSLRQARGATCEIVGYSRNPDKRAELIRHGIVDTACDSVAEACVESDVIVVATPVDRIAEFVIQAADASPPDCLITDVGSTKAQIVEATNAHQGAAAKFVAAHPIAGSEKSGAQHARPDLFHEKLIVLTPTANTSAGLLQRARDFWQATGGRILQMSPAEHDTHLASVSHVPHLVSALVARMCSRDARQLVGSGWEDITRVAAGDPAMWTAICRENRAAISHELEKLSRELEGLRRIIGQQDDDALHAWLAQAKNVKEQSD